MLNPRTIDAAARAQRPALLVDGTGERGAGRLALRVRPPRAEWVAIWWRGGRRVLGVIGRYPDLSLRDARDVFAADWRPVIEAGGDPRASRRAARRAGTVADLFAEYVAHMRAEGARSWPEVDRALLTGAYAAADALGRHTRACAVTPAMVSAYLADTYGRGSRTAADRYRAYLHAAFRWGSRAANDYTRAAGPAGDYALTGNPVAAVPRDTGATRARDRWLSADELRALWLALDGPGFGASTGPAVRILIATGQRVLDVLRAEAGDLDLEAATWTIPAAKRKTGAAGGDHVVPLPAIIVPHLRELVAVRHGLLFPHAERAGAHVPDQTVNRALARWSAAAGVARFQARDLRRTWKTHAGAAGLSKEIRDRLQGHALTDVSARHYDRHAYNAEKRSAMARWSAFLNALVTGRNKSNVVRIL